MEFSMANGLDACQHTIVKYVTRFRDKGGVQDLEKAKHVINMLIEFETAEEGKISMLDTIKAEEMAAMAKDKARAAKAGMDALAKTTTERKLVGDALDTLVKAGVIKEKRTHHDRFHVIFVGEESGEI